MVIGYKSEKDTLPSTWTQLLVDSLGHDPPSSHAQRPWGGVDGELPASNTSVPFHAGSRFT